jgi:hypothetical protein
MIFQGRGTPDGRYLLIKLQSRYNPGYGPPFPEEIALYAPATGAIQVIGKAQDNLHGLTGYVADNQWVAWYQRGLPEESSDNSWTLYAYNIASGTTQIIAHNNPSSPFYPTPQLDHGKLVWDEVDGAATPDRANYVVQMLDLNTGTRTTLAKRAGAPLISWPWVEWSQVTTADGTGGHEAAENLLTGQQSTIPAMAESKALVGTSFVYASNATNNTAFVYIPDITHPTANNQTYDPSGDGAYSINGLTFNGRYIGWHSLGDDTPLLYDVQQRRVIAFPLKYPFLGTQTTYIIGNYVTWIEDPNTQAAETASYQQQHKAPPYILSIVNLQAAGS